MRLSLPHPVGPVFRLNPDLMEEGITASRLSPRRRIILPIHRSPGDLVQRMVNFLQPGTCIRAHLHPRVSASETIFVIAGSVGLVTFSNEGSVDSLLHLRKGDLIDLEAGVWHTFVVFAEDTILLEIKRGPFNDEDKVFAEWAPEEGCEKAPAYLRSLESLFQENLRGD